MIQIEFSPLNDGFYSVMLDNKQYHLRLTYNDIFNYWSFGVYDSDKQPIVVGRKLIRGFPINVFDKDKLGMPPGLFYVDCPDEEVGHDDLQSGKAKFYYITAEERKELTSE